MNAKLHISPQSKENFLPTQTLAISVLLCINIKKKQKKKGKKEEEKKNHIFFEFIEIENPSSNALLSWQEIFNFV